MAEDKKAMNIKKLASLNVNTGKQSSPTNVKKRTILGAGVSGSHGERLRSLDKVANSYATNNPNSKFLKAIRNSKDNGLPTGTQTPDPTGNDRLYKIKKMFGPSLGMKKGGKVKAKKPRDGRIKKAKSRDGIAQRGKTRGRMR